MSTTSEKSHSRSRSKKSALTRLEGKLRALAKRHSLGLEEYACEVGEQLRLFMDSCTQQLEAQLGRCMASLLEGFTSRLQDLLRVNEKHRISKEIEVYVHWNENMLEEIQRNDQADTEERIQGVLEELRRQEEVLAGSAAREQRLQELLGQHGQAEDRPSLKLDLKSIKRAEFH